MYKINLLVRYIISILTITIIVLADNRFILWLLLFLLTLYNLNKKKYLLLAFDIILVLFLVLSNEHELALYLFKIGYIYVFIVTMFYTLSRDELLLFDSNNDIIKNKFYEEQFDSVVDRINNKKSKIYDDYVSNDDKIEEDLERKYLQSKIRYNGYYKTNNKVISWNLLDIIVLVLCLILFTIMFILR